VHSLCPLFLQTFKISPSELQVAFPHLADQPSQDPLLLAVIGRITTKI